LQNELAGVGIFAFIPFERNVKDAKADGRGAQKDDGEENPGEGKTAHESQIENNRDRFEPMLIRKFAHAVDSGVAANASFQNMQD